MKSLVTEHAPDVVLLPGDLTHMGVGKEALGLLQSLPARVLAVPGNMDAPFAVGEIGRRGGLDGTDPVVIDGISFGGPRVDRGVDVLVVHEPPAGTLDRVPTGRHIGSQHVLTLVTRLRPRVLTCGHVHESPGIERVEDTLVVNCTMGDGRTGGAVIEISAEHVDVRLV